MRRVSIGMIEAVLLIKYCQYSAGQYRSTWVEVPQYFCAQYYGTSTGTGRCLNHLSKSLLPGPGRVPWRLLRIPLEGSAWRRGVSCMASCPAVFPAPLLYLIIYSAEGELLGARIAPDGQWRFPAADSLPDKFVDCLLTYEDKRFFYHPGIDPAAIFRAIRLEQRSGAW